MWYYLSIYLSHIYMDPLTCAHPNYCYNICIIIHVGSFPYQLIDTGQFVTQLKSEFIVSIFLDLYVARDLNSTFLYLL